MQVYDKYSGHCAYCGKVIAYKDMQVDHLVPLYWHGGSDDMSNYMPACRKCNFYKSTFLLEDFRKQLETLVTRLEKVFIFQLAVRYGLVKVSSKPVIFYFEEVERGQNMTNTEANREDLKKHVEEAMKVECKVISQVEDGSVEIKISSQLSEAVESGEMTREQLGRLLCEKIKTILNNRFNEGEE